jgi:hypothetical protein
VYGCPSVQSPLLALCLFQRLPCFSIADCVFRITPGKATTARAVCFIELGIAKSYTLEVSQAGYVDAAGLSQHFSIEGACAHGRSRCVVWLPSSVPTHPDPQPPGIRTCTPTREHTRTSQPLSRLLD